METKSDITSLVNEFETFGRIAEDNIPSIEELITVSTHQYDGKHSQSLKRLRITDKDAKWGPEQHRGQ